MSSKLTDGVLQLSVKIRGKTRKADLAKELNIDQLDLNDQMARQPSLFAWYATLHALAQDQHDRAKRAHSVLYANLDEKWRKFRTDEGLKVTDKVIDADINRSSDYEESASALLEAKRNMNLTSSAVEAFRQRKDMLQSIGSNLRAEMETDLRTAQRKAREVKEKKPN